MQPFTGTFLLLILPFSLFQQTIQENTPAENETTPTSTSTKPPMSSRKLSDIKQIFMGCYEDKDANNALARPDIKGYASLLTTPDPELCCFICRSRGWPICGLQEGVQCHCGCEYGFYGPSTDCHYSGCEAFVCGGSTANSVYYSLGKSLADRPYNLTYFNSPLTYKSARLTCISKLGELVSPLNSGVIDSIVQATNTISSKVWLGMHMPQGSSSYEWTEQLLELSYASSLTHLLGYWKSGDGKDGKCVVMDTATKKWSSVDCEGAGYAFVCKLFATLPVNPDDAPASHHSAPSMNTTKEEKGSGIDEQKTLIMFIVVPIFLICYAGSCIAYCAYKISRNCSERAMIAKVTNFFEEERMNRMFQTFKPSLNKIKEEPKVEEFNELNRDNMGKSINKILLDKIKAKKNLKNYM